MIHYKIMDRRSFLKLSGLLGLGVASAGIIPARAEAVRFNKKQFKASRTEMAMGTFVTMTLIHPSKDQAEEAIGHAFNEAKRLEKVLSRFDQSTAIALLNKEGRLNDVPPEVSHVITEAIRYFRLTNGSFDITVKPVVDLFKEKLSGKQKAMPTDKELKEVLKLVGSQNIELNQRSVLFHKPGMGITLDGIAKGFIVDRASEMLSKHNIINHLINAGGDIRARGSKSGGKPWTIAIQDPKKKKNYPDSIRMKDGAIATSGNYEVYFDREKMFHHIINPQNGLSPALIASVSVKARSAIEADALSTSVFVMGSGKGTKFINSLPNCESLVIRRTGNQKKSKGWESATI